MGKGKFKLYASYGKNKLADLYAINNNGKRIDVMYKKRQGTNAVLCVVCVFVNGESTCFKISCDDVPAPKAKKNQ